MFCHELLMGTFFYDGALIKDNDFGSVLDRRQPVSNNKTRAAHHQAVQGLLDDAFTFRVKGTCCFVKDQDTGVLEDGPGNGNALALAAGNIDAPVTKLCIIALRQLLDELIGICGFSRCNDFIPRCIQPSINCLLYTSPSPRD